MKKVWLFLPLLAGVIFFATKCEDDDGPTVPLPAAIQTYLDTHYPGAEIEESEIDTLCTGTAVYEVEIEVSDDHEIELTFDSEGNLLFTETEIKISDLPAAVSAGVSANYADYTIEEASKLDLGIGGSQYEVELKKGSSHLEVLFDADGTKICEKAGDDDDE